MASLLDVPVGGRLRSNMRPVIGPAVLLCAAACAAPQVSEAPSASRSTREAERAPVQSSRPPAVAIPEAAPIPFPTTCVTKDERAKPCELPSDFANRLCDGNHQNEALMLFAKGSPWARRYVRGEVRAWDASGAATEEMKLLYGEEVIVLRKREAPAGGMVVSGTSNTYDVVRWDGSCVTLDGGEVAPYHLPQLRSAEIDWSRLSREMQDALLADHAVVEAYKARRSECKGAGIGAVSDACEKARQALSKAIVGFVRRGGKLPVPETIL